MNAGKLGLVELRFPQGRYNAITDVVGVKVAHETIIVGTGPLVRGEGPIRTGVTAVSFREDIYDRPLRAGAHVINGYGKAIGLSQLCELGQLETPIVLTGTLNAFLAADALVDYMLSVKPQIGIALPTVNPVVLECSDAYLNDIQGRHVRKEHVLKALASAQSGPIAQGSVGAGTGMIAFGFKAGIGTASRLVSGSGRTSVVGTLVLANYGKREQLRIKGVKVGDKLKADIPSPGPGSVIVIFATDAPVSERQLDRMARRAVIGLARLGGEIEHGSGEFVIGVSTSEQQGIIDDSSSEFADLCRAVIDTTEEAVLNSLLNSKTMRGRDDRVCPGLPVEQVMVLISQ